MIYLFSVITFIILFYIFYKISFLIKLVDKPNYRKIHKGEIPLIGGILIYSNILIFYNYFNQSYYFSIIFYTSAILLILGILDDVIELGVTFRLISQLVSCLIIIGSGLIILNIGDYSFIPNIEIGILSTFFTVFCVIGLTNAFNFIDGSDGLCGGMFLVSIISLLSFSLLSENLFLIQDIKIIYVLIISIIFFLLFNISNYFKIFLGDSGSMFLGFLISWLLILFTQEYKTIHPVLALWCVTIPTFDIISVIIRRLIRKKNPFKPDRRHIHHILLNLKIKSGYVTLIILFSSLIINFIGYIILSLLGPFDALLSYIVAFIFYLYLSIKLSRLAMQKSNSNIA